MALKNNQLFSIERIKVAKIQGRTNTRQNCSRVDAPLKENLEFFVFFKVFRTLGTSHWKKPIQGAQVLHQGGDWRGLGRLGATVQPGMSSTISTSSPSTWTEEYHQELQENKEINNDQDNEVRWASYSGSEAAEIAEYCASSSSATSGDEHGPETGRIQWWDYASNELQQAIDFYEAQQQQHQDFDMWDSSNEGSCCKTTTSRRKDRRPLTAKEAERFDKEMHEFFKNYRSFIGFESA